MITNNPHKSKEFMSKAMKECKTSDDMNYSTFYNSSNYVSPGIHARSFYKLYLSLVSEGDKWLDLGCGSANFICKAIDEAGVDIKGIEVVEESCKIAIKNGIDCHLGSISEPFPYGDESFTLVTATDVLEHLHPNHVERVLKEAYRVCKVGGHAMFAPFPKPDKTGIIHLTVQSTDWWVKQCELVGFAFVKKVNDYGFVLKKL